jgi:hypothetical protein
VSIRSELRAIRAEPDPVHRARQASALINDLQQQSVELARLRREAIEEAVRTRGMSFTQVAQEVGLSKGRITQIRQSAPPVERAFFGVGPVRVAVPIRTIGDRDLGVVAAEDTRSAESITNVLRGLAFEVEHFEIPADGSLTIGGDEVVICGPKSSKQITQLLEDDPHFTFAPDHDGRWTITERSTKFIYRSGMDDQPPTDQDSAYLSARTIDDDRLIMVAGIHAMGSLGAVNHLAEHLTELHEHTKTHANFSTVINSSFDGLTITATQQAADLHTWD